MNAAAGAAGRDVAAEAMRRKGCRNAGGDRFTSGRRWLRRDQNSVYRARVSETNRNLNSLATRFLEKRRIPLPGLCVLPVAP